MKHILIVEDDPFIIELYSGQLKKNGYKVSVAKDGVMALEKIAEAIPDLLILDINLPKMNGWDVLKKIREDAKTKDLRVIILSNNNEEECREDIAACNVMKYFVKVQTTTEDISAYVESVFK